MMQQLPNGDVEIKLSGEDFAFLMRILGYAAGSAMMNGNRELWMDVFSFANRLNEGNPEYCSYDMDRVKKILLDMKA